MRLRIDTTPIIKRLHKTALGKDEMTANELTAARILLNKTVPDLKAIEVSAGDGMQDIKSVSTAALLRIIEGTSERLDAPVSAPAKPKT